MDSAASATNSSHENEHQCGETIVDIEPGPSPRPARWRPECCIYRVPKRLRNVKNEAYTPKLISIGPVHHKNDELKDMESLKERYYKEFFNQKLGVEKDFEKIVEDNIDKIRHCYAEEIFKEDEIKKDEKDFKHMILRDSIFIIQLLWRSFCHRREDDKDYILSKPLLADGIKQDLILLENQLPFFILDELYQCQASKDTQNSFLMLACNYFFNGDKKRNIDKEVKYFTDLHKEKKVKHFTDLLRYLYCPGNPEIGPTIEHLCSATKLDEAGLKFQKWEDLESKHRHLLDIRIKKRFSCLNCAWLHQKRLPRLNIFSWLDVRAVELPCFVADAKTEGVFRNLMALEQCHYPFEAYICNYIVLLIFLINTKEDVELLVENRIIVNALGNNSAIAKLVRDLGREIVEANSCYSKVAKSLNRHVKKTTFLKTVYFRDVWRGTACVLGFLVTFATIGSFLLSLRPL